MKMGSGEQFKIHWEELTDGLNKRERLGMIGVIYDFQCRRRSNPCTVNMISGKDRFFFYQ